MNLPNKLTVLRIILAFVFIVLLFLNGLGPKIAALIFFLLASLTDLLDGFIAKRNNQITNFGKVMDPIADKILVLSAFLVFVELGIVAAWMVAIIIFREIAVTTLRFFALSKGKVIAATSSGKHKTVWQIFVISIILTYVIFAEGGRRVFGFWNDSINVFYKHAIFVLMWITVLLTLISGLSYFIKNREVYCDEKTH